VISLFFFYLFLGIVENYIFREALIQSDLRIINLLQIFRTPNFSRFMLIVTSLGNVQIIIVGVLLIGLWSAYTQKWHYLMATIISVAGSAIVVLVVKLLFHRPRPSLANSVIQATGYSFPSDHSFIAFALYGLLTYFLLKQIRSTPARIAVFILGVLVVFLIGFSRLYLGVHWPSDVLAGYTFGLAWITILIKPFRSDSDFFPCTSFSLILIKRSRFSLLILITPVMSIRVKSFKW